jgi:phosphatidylserine/phosphatidylglycerophosphate/cardiolipin synthase-like enzyme
MYNSLNMTLRRGVSLGIALVALVAYGFMRAPAAPAITAVLTPQVSGNVSLIIEPDAGVAPILSYITNASTSVDLVMYELEDTNVEQALASDAARGIAVRVLLNEGYYGKKENTTNDAAYQYLTAHDVSVHWTPAYFALTHQKTLIIDDNTAIIMTMNLTPQYYASSREFNIVDTDANDISAIESTFTDDWNDENVAAQNGNDLIWSPGSENALLAIINGAHSSLDIYNEEMADAKVTSALEAAAQRGVVVRVDMTYASEWKSTFSALTQTGAQVRTYAANAPLYIHAKMIIADNARAFVGSENFSSGSLQNNRELGIITSDQTTVGSIEQTFEKDWTGASIFTP